MPVPRALTLLSALMVVLALAVPTWRDAIAIAAPCLVASLLLWHREARQCAAARAGGAREWVVLDGSNVMHWRDGAAKIATLRSVIAALQRRGFTASVIFDANAGYLLLDRYMDAADLAQVLKLPAEQVRVVDKGRPADPVILKTARDLNARIVTNDRYRDWAKTYPEVAADGHLITGGFGKGGLWLDLPHMPSAA